MKVQGFILMGVAGSGKTSIGKMLAERLGWDFLDADDFHPAENIAKMAAGIPLNDDDRSPWLASLHDRLSSMLKAGKHPILACSVLKEAYRQRLMDDGNGGLVLVYLKGSYDLIYRRISERAGHYMKPEMLQSQFATLEEPKTAFSVDIDQSPEEIVQQIISIID